MARLYLVRHGRPQSGWGETADPGLDAAGRDQACQAALSLRARIAGARLVSSPLRRALETARPFVPVLGRPVEIEPAVAEIPSRGAEPAERQAWLETFAQSTWSDAPPEVAAWRAALAAYVLGLDATTVIVSHFMAINGLYALATGETRTCPIHPDHASVTVFEVGGGRIELV